MHMQVCIQDTYIYVCECVCVCVQQAGTYGELEIKEKEKEEKKKKTPSKLKLIPCVATDYRQSDIIITPLNYLSSKILLLILLLPFIFLSIFFIQLNTYICYIISHFTYKLLQSPFFFFVNLSTPGTYKRKRKESEKKKFYCECDVYVMCSVVYTAGVGGGFVQGEGQFLVCIYIVYVMLSILFIIRKKLRSDRQRERERQGGNFFFPSGRTRDRGN